MGHSQLFSVSRPVATLHKEAFVVKNVYKDVNFDAVRNADGIVKGHHLPRHLLTPLSSSRNIYIFFSSTLYHSGFSSFGNGQIIFKLGRCSLAVNICQYLHKWLIVDECDAKGENNLGCYET